MSSLLRQTLLMPLWLAQVFTQEKFFARNPIIGNRWLNEHGLHTARVAIACRLAEARRIIEAQRDRLVDMGEGQSRAVGQRVEALRRQIEPLRQMRSGLTSARRSVRGIQRSRRSRADAQ